MHRIDGPGATVDNKFTDGDPVGGVPATVVTDDWLNDVQENIMAVLAAAGITPTKGRAADLLDSISGRFIGTKVFFASGSYIPTAGMKKARVRELGGGGGGGGAPITAAGNVGLGAGGHAGAYAEGVFTAAQIGASQVVTVGGGGAGSTGTGATGGATSFGALLVAAGGIGGGSAGNAAPPISNGNGGSAATSSGGNLNAVGQLSTIGLAFTVSVGYSGSGAASAFGAGGGAVNSTSNGQNGFGYGSGGSGAYAGPSNASARTGGNGTQGFVIVEEWV